MHLLARANINPLPDRPGVAILVIRVPAWNFRLCFNTTTSAHFLFRGRLLVITLVEMTTKNQLVTAYVSAVLVEHMARVRWQIWAIRLAQLVYFMGTLGTDHHRFGI